MPTSDSAGSRNADRMAHVPFADDHAPRPASRHQRSLKRRCFLPAETTPSVNALSQSERTTCRVRASRSPAGSFLILGSMPVALHLRVRHPKVEGHLGGSAHLLALRALPTPERGHSARSSVLGRPMHPMVGRVATRTKSRGLTTSHQSHTGVLRQGGAEPLALLPDLEHDLAACVSACDPAQRLANLAQRQDRFDLRA